MIKVGGGVGGFSGSVRPVLKQTALFIQTKENPRFDGISLKTTI
jgi:hypothetical protein